MEEIKLPYEVLVYLFKYLTSSDRKSCSETCQSWYSAANDLCFLKNKTVVFHKTDLNDEASPLKEIENSIFPFPNYLFSEVEISSKLNEFWYRNGPNIKSLTIRKCDVHEKLIHSILHQCTNLETLNIETCKELFMSGCLLENTNEWIAESFRNLKSLSLADNIYLTDALFSRFVRNAPVLENLCLSECSFNCHGGLINRFYLKKEDVIENPSQCVFTFCSILNFISSRAKHIKSLIFASTRIDGACLKSLSEISDLKLQYLNLNFCRQLTKAGLLSLATHQKSLKELDIGFCSQVTDQTVIDICDNLKNLEYLNIQRCRAVTDIGVLKLHELKQLKRLNISQCELITKKGIEEGICLSNNTVLEELNINSLTLVEQVIIKISETLINLRYLDLSFCFNAVTDTTIQWIFKHTVCLHTLKINNCDKVSDAGLTGMGTVKEDNDNDHIDEPEVFSCNEGNLPIRIHLGSRAEEEIIRDARRKRDVTRMCEKLTTKYYSGYSIVCLKNLRDLDMTGCNKISDVSLTYAFSFKELQRLNLSSCQQITVVGTKQLVKKCPAIEYLSLNDCFNLNDDAVIEIVKELRRLQHLELRGCIQLTDRVLEAIKDHCKVLKFLDLQGCHKISPELGCNIDNLPTLHTLLMTKPGPYITDGIKNRAPVPPPLF